MKKERTYSDDKSEKEEKLRPFIPNPGRVVRPRRESACARLGSDQ
jgi:hypothetical protein